VCAVTRSPTVIPPTIKPLTVSLNGAAELLGVSTQTVARYISAGLLRAAKPERRVLIRVADIEAMLDANPAQGAGDTAVQS
jgi:excisionase family DNA binding protein